MALNTLDYAEINDITAALAELEDAGFVVPVVECLQHPEPVSLQTPLQQIFLNQLTKPQLFDLATEAEFQPLPNKSATKSAWLEVFNSTNVIVA